ncbi:hypothetical protein [Longispora urticae]
MLVVHYEQTRKLTTRGPAARAGRVDFEPVLCEHGLPVTLLPGVAGRCQLASTVNGVVDTEARGRVADADVESLSGTAAESPSTANGSIAGRARTGRDAF